jgi:DNA polymerase V
MIDDLYQKDIGFKKCGVILTCLEPKAKHTYDFFTDMKRVGLDNIFMDYGRFGKAKLSLGTSMLPNRAWNMSRIKLTQNYFSWDQLLCVKQFLLITSHHNLFFLL